MPDQAHEEYYKENPNGNHPNGEPSGETLRFMKDQKEINEKLDKKIDELKNDVNTGFFDIKLHLQKQDLEQGKIQGEMLAGIKYTNGDVKILKAWKSENEELIKCLKEEKAENKEIKQEIKRGFFSYGVTKIWDVIYVLIGGGILVLSQHFWK